MGAQTVNGRLDRLEAIPYLLETPEMDQRQAPPREEIDDRQVAFHAGGQGSGTNARSVKRGESFVHGIRGTRAFGVPR
jgi:hypothetical protein